jgi:hypothetical protein
MVPRIIIRAALVVAAFLSLNVEARAQCTGQPPGNQVCASPNGVAGLPGFRALVPGDIPSLPPVGITVNSTTITGGTTGRIPYNNGGLYGEFVAAGDCTFSVPNFTCTRTGGLLFASSATTDTTNAANIGTGTLNSLRLDLATTAQFAAATANKVLAADKVFGPEVALTYGVTTTVDFSTFVSNASVTLTGNITTLALTNVKAGQSGLLRFIQDGTGSRTIPASLNSIFKCAGGCSYTLTTTANAVDALGYTCVSATYCIGGALLKDVK